MLRQVRTLRRLTASVAALILASAWAVAVPATAQAAVTQPPAPFDPSPINGDVYYLINQASSLQVDLNGNSTANGDNIVQNTRSFTNLSQRWAMTKAPSGNWMISNIQDASAWTACRRGESRGRCRTGAASALPHSNGPSGTPRMGTARL